jgi:multiple antibiotic resistance protein
MPFDAVLEVLKSCLLVLTALFPIVNPLGNTPIFLSLTPGYSSGSRIMLSRTLARNSFWLLTGSMLIGSHILDFFGLSIPVVQVGGGLVVMSTGWTLLTREDDQAKATAEKKKITSQDIATRAFYPLTLPLTVGPGSISVAITLGANQAPHRSSLVRFVPGVTIFLSYRFAERLGKFLGDTAMTVIVRLAAFILLCIGVQIVWNGIHALIPVV